MCDPIGGIKRTTKDPIGSAIPFSKAKQKELTRQLAGPEIKPPAPPPPPESFDQGALDARKSTRRNARGGRSSTILTGPTGAPVSGGPKTLLGS